MTAIEIRRLTGAETYAYSVKRRSDYCDVTGCKNGYRYLAVGAKAGRVERELLCEVHGSAWAGQHRQPLRTAAAS